MIFKLTAAVPQLWQFLVSLVRSLLLRIIESITEFPEQSELTERKAEEGQWERKSEWEMCYCQDLVFFCFHCKKIMMWSCHSLQKMKINPVGIKDDFKALTQSKEQSKTNRSTLHLRLFFVLCVCDFCCICRMVILHCERWEVWSQGCLEVRDNHNLEELEDSHPSLWQNNIPKNLLNKFQRLLWISKSHEKWIPQIYAINMQRWHIPATFPLTVNKQLFSEYHGKTYFSNGTKI